MFIFEIAGQSQNIKAPNEASFKYVGHECYEIFFESCQLSLRLPIKTKLIDTSRK